MMISNTTGIRPSQFHFILLPLLLGHAPFSRQILLSQRPGFTTRASLFCHHQNPKTFPASFPQKIITSIQERKSSTNPAATPVAVKDEVVLSRKEKKKENKALRLNFIKKVYIYLGSQFWFTGLVYTVFKIAGHTPNPALSFSASGSSVVLLALGFYYTLYDSKWKSINSMFLGLYSLATTVLFGRDLAILNGKAMLASGAATLAIVVSVTKLAFWEPEKKPMALEFRPLFIMLTLPVQIIAGCIQIWAPGPISTAIYHGITIISLSNIVFHQSKRLLKVSDENDKGFNNDEYKTRTWLSIILQLSTNFNKGFNPDEYTVASVQLFVSIALLFWTPLMTIREPQVYMV